MKAVVVTTESVFMVKELTEPLYRSANQILGGLIEVVHPKRLKKPYCMLVNEEGLLIPLPWNAFGSYLYGTDCHGQPIVGNIIVLKEGYTDEGEKDLFGLGDQEAENMLLKFQLTYTALVHKGKL